MMPREPAAGLKSWPQMSWMSLIASPKSSDVHLTLQTHAAKSQPRRVGAYFLYESQKRFAPLFCLLSNLGQVWAALLGNQT